MYIEIDCGVLNSARMVQKTFVNPMCSEILSMYTSILIYLAGGVGPIMKRRKKIHYIQHIKQCIVQLISFTFDR